MARENTHEDTKKLFDALGLVTSIEREQYPENVCAATDRASEALEDAAIEVQFYHEE